MVATLKERGRLPYTELAEVTGISPEAALAYLELMEKAGELRMYSPEKCKPSEDGRLYRHFEIVPSGLRRELGKVDRMLAKMK